MEDLSNLVLLESAKEPKFYNLSSTRVQSRKPG
jgi:hypothetical protein